jgi:hypothetical protein
MGTDDAIGGAAVVLRAAVAVLLLANVGFYAWTQGWLGGDATRGDREPERLVHQVQPEIVRILPPAGTGARSRAPAAPPAAAAEPVPAARLAATNSSGAGSGAGAPTCLQAGPFTPAEVGKVEAALQAALPAARGAWSNVRIETPGIWLVYMGKYPDRETLRAKMDELRRYPNLSFEELQGAAALEPGIVLGRHDSRDAAEAALARLAERGVRTAKVVALSPPAAVHMLRVERADAALKLQLGGLSPGTLAGTTFLPCPAGAAANDTAASGTS